MKNREHIIEIDRLVLTGAPGPAEIEVAVLRALRDARAVDALGEPGAEVRVAGEVTRSVLNGVKGGKK